MAVLTLAAVAPFGLWSFITMGGIRWTMSPPKAALGLAVVVLPVPVIICILFAVAQARRFPSVGDLAYRPNGLRLSLLVCFFWIGVLCWRGYEDVAFQRTVEAKFQPWAETILSEPRAAVLTNDSPFVKDDLVPRFLRPDYMRTYVVILDTPRYGSSEPCVRVNYGTHATSDHGYVAGRKSLRLKEGRNGVRKLKDGIYRFWEDT